MSVSGQAHRARDADPIGLALLDVDGTLLNSRLELSERCASAMKRCSDVGVVFALMSGRPLQSLVSLAAGLRGIRFLVSGNGSIMQDLHSGSIRAKQEFTSEVLGRLLDFGVTHRLGICLHAQDGWYACGDRTYVEVEIERSRTRPVAWLGLGQRETIPGDMKILKILFVGPPSVILEGRYELEDNVSGLSVLISYPEYLEAMPAGVTKAGFVAEMISLLKAKRSAILAVGDGDNDVEMLLAADIAVCVANATALARDSARYMVPSNDEDGVAVALEAFVLGIDNAWREVRSL